MEQQKINTREWGYSRNWFGRKRRLPLLKQYPGDMYGAVVNGLPQEIAGKVAEQDRQCLNFPPSSSGADVTGIALVRSQKIIYKEVKEELKLKIIEEELPVKLMLQIHDAIVSEARDDFYEEWCHIARQAMIKPMGGMNVPLEIEMEVGKNWVKLELFKYDS